MDRGQRNAIVAGPLGLLDIRLGPWRGSQVCRLGSSTGQAFESSRRR